MKKALFLIAIVMVAFSCNKSDDDSTEETSDSFIVGTWKRSTLGESFNGEITFEIPFGGCDLLDRFKFSSDGRFEQKTFNLNTNDECVLGLTQLGDYNVTEFDRLVFNFDDGAEVIINDLSFQGSNKMTWEFTMESDPNVDFLFITLTKL